MTDKREIAKQTEAAYTALRTLASVLPLLGIAAPAPESNVATAK